MNYHELEDFIRQLRTAPHKMHSILKELLAREADACADLTGAGILRDRASNYRKVERVRI